MNKWRKNISYSLVALFLFACGEKEENKPKIIIAIIVDQMPYEYLVDYSSFFGQDGFNKLVNNGLNCTNAFYNYKPSYTAPGHASIFTGYYPAKNGIIANSWYDQLSNKSVYCVSEIKSNKEVFYSPLRMQKWSISDWIKIQTNGKGKCFGISLKDRGAILSAGRLADAAYWFDGDSGNWVTSSFYQTKIPNWLNQEDLNSKYLNKIWALSMDSGRYISSAEDQAIYKQPYLDETGANFPYDLKKGFEKMGFNIFKSTPSGNELLTDLAIRTITEEDLGLDENPDFLAVSYSSTDYIGHQFGRNSREVQDAFIKLDKDIARLLEFLEARFGENQFLVMLSSDHGVGVNPQSLIDAGFSAGYFDLTKLKSNMNEALSNKYGKGNWLLRIQNLNCYLNDSLIMEKNLNKQEIYESLLPILSKEPGIEGVYFNDSNHTLTKDELVRIKNGRVNGRSGDIILCESPNWVVNERSGSTHGSPYEYDTHVPVLFFGFGIQKGEYSENMKMIDVAPSLMEKAGFPLEVYFEGRSIWEKENQ